MTLRLVREVFPNTNDFNLYLPRSLNTQCDWRAVEPLNHIPSSFLKHSVRLASRRAASDKRLGPGPVFCSCSVVAPNSESNFIVSCDPIVDL